jgi:UDP-N-acetylmuramoylalanine--D-glutamate ligase
MRIEDLSGKTVCLLGFGKEGQATLKALETFAPGCEVTVADKNEAITVDTKKHWLQVGSGWLKNLEKFDVIIKSPGIPHQPEFDAVKEKITNSTQIFLDSVRSRGSMVVGVTGTKGKSTVSSLIYAVLKEGGKDVYLVGNIGKPALGYLEHSKKNTIFVQEMSSYQLQECTTSPDIAVVTSFFPEHLDYHGSLEAYKDAKMHIARFQKPADIVFYNGKWESAKEIAEESPGKKVPYLMSGAPVTLEETKLIGEHNLENIAVAWRVGEYLGVSKEAAIAAFKKFEPLPHRLQSLGVYHGIEWIDDAISTTPESTIAALRALGDKVRTIILGGQDRGLDFMSLAKEVVKHSSVQTVILFPGTGPRIKEAMQKIGTSKISFCDAETMEEAVRIAKEKTPKGSVCLLSTASPSYNMFKNFEEKGERFAECVRNGELKIEN